MTTSASPTRDNAQFPGEDGDPLSIGDRISPSIYDVASIRNIWDRHLKQQIRVLLYTEPLRRVLRRDEYHSEEREHYDSLALALKLLDHIVTHTGVEHEADSDTVIHDLLPLMEAMDQAANIRPDIERQIQMAKIVLGDLRNDREGQRPFKRAYTDFT